MFGPSLDIGATLTPLAPSAIASPPVFPAAGVLPPVLILVLCVVAGIGTLLLLPGRREAALRKIGGAVILAAGLILAALLVRATAGTGGMGVYFWIFSAVGLLSALRVITHPKPVYSALYFVLAVFASAGLFVLLWAEFMAVALVLIYAGAILVTYVFVIMLAAEATPTSGPMAGLAEHDAVSREPLIASAVGFAMMGVMLFVIFEKADGLSANAQATSAAVVSGTHLQPLPGSERAEYYQTAEYKAESAKRAGQHPELTRNLQYSYADPYPTTRPVGEAASAGGSSPTTPPFTPQGGVQQLGAYLFRHQLVNLELAGLILTVAMIGAIVIARRRVVSGDTIGQAIRDANAETVLGPATPIDDDPHSIPVYGTENPRQKAYPET